MGVRRSVWMVIAWARAGRLSHIHADDVMWFPTQSMWCGCSFVLSLLKASSNNLGLAPFDSSGLHLRDQKPHIILFITFVARGMGVVRGFDFTITVGDVLHVVGMRDNVERTLFYLL